MKAVREVLTRELPRLRRFAYSLTADGNDADDLAHSVIVKVLEKGLPDNEDPVPWLLTVCKNLWFDNMRREEVKQRHLSEMAITEEPQYKDPSGANIDAVKLIEKMQLLSEGQRAALSLTAIEGLGYAEAAQILGVPTGTIMSRVCRARIFLKEHYGDQQGNPQ